jgi:hypothetical protein
MSTTYKPVYAASATVGVGTAFNSLASSSTRLAGAQTDQVDNTSTLYDDILLSGTVKLGTSPSAEKQGDLWVIACKDWSSAYPDVITGSGSAAKTWTSANVQAAGGQLIKSMKSDATTGRLLEFDNLSVAAYFGGVLPRKFVVFLAHDTGVNLDASAGFVCNALGVNWQGV